MITIRTKFSHVNLAINVCAEISPLMQLCHINGAISLTLLIIPHRDVMRWSQWEVHEANSDRERRARALQLVRLIST